MCYGGTPWESQCELGNISISDQDQVHSLLPAFLQFPGWIFQTPPSSGLSLTKVSLETAGNKLLSDFQLRKHYNKQNANESSDWTLALNTRWRSPFDSLQELAPE